MSARYLCCRSWSLLALSILFAALLAGACRRSGPAATAATQIVLIIDADPEVRDVAFTVSVDIERYGSSGMSDGSRVSNTFPVAGPEATPWPIEFPLKPRDGNSDRVYRITATVFDSTEPIAVLRAQNSFASQQSIEVHLRFSIDCLYAASLDCSEQQTCEAGSCIDTSTDQDPRVPGWAPAGAAVSPTRAGSNNTNRAAAGSGSPPLSRSGAGVGGASEANAAGSGAAASIPTTPTNPTDPTNPQAATSGGDCGDGRLNSGEQCDTAIAAGETGACPSACGQTEACQVAQLEGSGCQTACVNYGITTFAPDDGCCPPGGDSTTDPDCGAVCGNGIVESAETCDPADTCPAPEACSAANTCLRASIVGDAATCTVACEMQTVEQCVPGDGCCPSNCSMSNDSDCSPSCGDGVVDAASGELCEPGSTTQPCPTVCDDSNACTRDILTGAAANCNATCTSVEIVWPINGDGCCPAGANANLDRDCQPLCGNRVVEPNERCDDRCPTLADCDDGIPCTSDSVAGEGCDRRCVHTTITTLTDRDSCCPAGANANNDSDCQPVCGNREVERGETCDGNCVQAASCNDNVACTEDIVVGNDCQRVCGHLAVAASGPNRDGCCPDPRTMAAYMDADCPARCGNNNVEPGETCDGNCPACADTDSDACTRAATGGTACNPTCTRDRITTAQNNDQCCPANVDPSTDNDCRPRAMCGNGTREEGEMCDPCPSQCNDMDPCTRDRLEGSGCNAHCERDPIGAGPMDGCCPSGATPTTDGDCRPAGPVCGNDRVETGETCDPCPTQCRDSDPCTRDELVGDDCNIRCTHDPIPAGRMDGCCPGNTDMEDDPDCPARA